MLRKVNRGGGVGCLLLRACSGAGASGVSRAADAPAGSAKRAADWGPGCPETPLELIALMPAVSLDAASLKTTKPPTVASSCSCGGTPRQANPVGGSRRWSSGTRTSSCFCVGWQDRRGGSRRQELEELSTISTVFERLLAVAGTRRSQLRRGHPSHASQLRRGHPRTGEPRTLLQHAVTLLQQAVTLLQQAVATSQPHRTVAACTVANRHCNAPPQLCNMPSQNCNTPSRSRNHIAQ